MKKKQFTITGISIWRIFAYFVIYSFIGYIIETLYAFVLYGVIESRQSFLYGPFCSIYGLGAVVMICTLQYFGKDIHTLFLGGFLSGSITEYIVSFIGEKLLNTKWWDYSDKFLNINGRICLIYSIFWGLLGLYLIKVVNPLIDKLISWIKTKCGVVKLRSVATILTVALIIDCIVSGIAIDFFLTRVAVENDLDISHKEQRIEKYNQVYVENTNLSKFIYKYWGNNKMIKTYPNLTIRLANGELKRIKEFYPDIEPYYFLINNNKD
ncbi:MAG: putative ABC transporter permease [Clostridia bacterium]|nr:putative ABC transporter permease [Clostridia bacterium]